MSRASPGAYYKCTMVQLWTILTNFTDRFLHQESTAAKRNCLSGELQGAGVPLPCGYVILLKIIRVCLDSELVSRWSILY